MMKLWASDASPYVRKARVVIIEKGLEDQVSLEFVNNTPFEAASGLRDNNPLGKIPCLVLEDGQSVIDSRVICRYLDSLAAGPILHPSGNVRQNTLVALIDGILDAAVLSAYETRYRPEELIYQNWIDAQWVKIASTLQYVEREYMDVLAHFDLASIGMVCALEYLDLRHDARNWREVAPELADWHKNNKDRESFAATRPKA